MKIITLMLSICAVIVIALVIPTPAHACWVCDVRLDGSPFCNYHLQGGEFCVLYQPKPNSCLTYYPCDECPEGNCNCPPTGCPAKLDNPLGKPEIRQCSIKVARNGKFQLAGMTDKAKLKDFLRRIDSGQFNEPARVYMSRHSSIALGLMNSVPIEHWNKWQFGFEKDVDGKTVKVYHLETKTGKTATIVLK